jgi:hypothetical protein
MIICKLDVVRSTEALEKRGHVVTVEIRIQLDALIGRLLTDLPNEAAPTTPLVKDLPNPYAPPSPYRFHGERQGDGVMLGAPRTHALTMLRAAMTIRDEPAWQHPTWHPLRFALGIAEVSWDREPYAPGSVPNGRDIVIISRLLSDQCSPGSIVVNEALLRAIREYDHGLLALFELQSAELKGIEGSQTFGLVPPRHRPPAEALRTRWRDFVQTSWLPAVLTGGCVTLGALAWARVVWWWLGS